jgi:hypothetical protein
MQVNFFPESVCVMPALLHFCPAFGAAAKEVLIDPMHNRITSRIDVLADLIFI